MNREEFMGQLNRLLWDIPESDRQDAIAYYNAYFDEAGVENEAKVIQELGSPGKVAATIKAGLNAAGDEQAEYTDRGYCAGKERENQNPLSKAGDTYQGAKKKGNMPWPLIIVLLIFASPILLGVGGGLLGGIIGLLCGAFGILLAVILCGAAFLISGVVCFVIGIVRIMFSPIEGLITAGIGSLLLAAGILLTLLFIWCMLKWFPAMFRGIVNLIQRLFYRVERR